MNERETEAGYEPNCAEELDASIVRYELYPLGEQAIVIRWVGNISEAMLGVVSATVRCLEHDCSSAIVEFVRAYRTVTVYYDPAELYVNKADYHNKGKINAKSTLGSREQEDDVSPYEILCAWIRSRLNMLGDPLLITNALEHQEVRIVPVCFDMEFGPDLQMLAEQAGLSVQEAIALYCSATYVVHMVGFTHGFPYMGGLSERLAMPRRSQPRAHVPQGTVGIAGTQTGIYPIASPGGWQLIGRTPLRLFNPMKEKPSLFQAGDRIRFEPISLMEFAVLANEASVDNESMES